MATTYLSRTPASAGNRKTWTWSGWVKKCYLSNNFKRLFAAGTSLGTNSDNAHGIMFNSTDDLFITGETGASVVFQLQTDRVFRDVNAWYHIVVAFDTTQATASNRVKVYVNGVQETSFSTATYPTQNLDTFFNATNVHYVGSDSTTNGTFDGSMAHVHWIDGTAYDASAFGETDATTGIWKPKTAPSVTYGTNGFFLKFENSGAFGTDSSGNGNNFTVNGTMTQTIDTPSNVFNTFSPLISSSYQTLSNGNLTTTGNTSADNGNVYSTLAVTKGKYYAEFKYTPVSGYPYVGIGNMEEAGYHGTQNSTTGMVSYSDVSPNVAYQANGNFYQNGSIIGTYTALSTNDILGVAIDLDNGAFYASVNGTWQNSGDPTSGASKTGALGTWTPADTLYTFGSANYNGSAVSANFGNGYFGTTAVSSAQNPDDGIGIFEHSVPSGYKALCTKSINSQEYS